MTIEVSAIHPSDIPYAERKRAHDRAIELYGRDARLLRHGYMMSVIRVYIEGIVWATLDSTSAR